MRKSRSNGFHYSLLLWLGFLWLNDVAAELPPNEEGAAGSVCAFADFNHDHLTDILVKKEKTLIVKLQNEEGIFKEGKQYGISFENEITSCAVADFNGDAYPDVLLTGKLYIHVFVLQLF